MGRALSNHHGILGQQHNCNRPQAALSVAVSGLNIQFWLQVHNAKTGLVKIRCFHFAVDLFFASDFSDEIANLTLAERPNALYKSGRSWLARYDTTSTDSEEVDSDSGYSSPLHRRKQAASSTHPVTPGLGAPVVGPGVGVPLGFLPGTSPPPPPAPPPGATPHPAAAAAPAPHLLPLSASTPTPTVPAVQQQDRHTPRKKTASPHLKTSSPHVTPGPCGLYAALMQTHGAALNKPTPAPTATAPSGYTPDTTLQGYPANYLQSYPALGQTAGSSSSARASPATVTETSYSAIVSNKAASHVIPTSTAASTSNIVTVPAGATAPTTTPGVSGANPSGANAKSPLLTHPLIDPLLMNMDLKQAQQLVSHHLVEDSVDRKLLLAKSHSTSSKSEPEFEAGAAGETETLSVGRKRRRRRSRRRKRRGADETGAVSDEGLELKRAYSSSNVSRCSTDAMFEGTRLLCNILVC